MSANPKFMAATAQVDEAAVQPLPKSRKVYVGGSRPDMRVPMREIAQSDTPTTSGTEENPPLMVYDTSGPYTDPSIKVDIRSGLAATRAAWIADRDDTEALAGPSIALRRRAPARSEAGRAALQPASQAAPRPGWRQPQWERDADALRAPRHHHAGDGIHRHPREPECRAVLGHAAATAPGHELRRESAQADHAGVRARRSGPRPRDHPGQHQSPRDRADDHRPQFPGEDQRQHRQLGGDDRRSAKKSRR